jgi:hypothetical protein
MRNKLMIGAFAVFAGVALACSSGGTDTKSPGAQDAATSAVATKPSAVEPTTKVPTTKPVSVEEQNAVRSAQNYLDTGAFSCKGLIRQLSSDAGDGYSLTAATYAVDSLHINLNEQAAKSAKTYLSTSSFSRKGLIEQLESDAGEGFTHSQAVYGVNKAGL